MVDESFIPLREELHAMARVIHGDKSYADLHTKEKERVMELVLIAKQAAATKEVAWYLASWQELWLNNRS